MATSLAPFPKELTQKAIEIKAMIHEYFSRTAISGCVWMKQIDQRSVGGFVEAGVQDSTTH